MKKLYLIFALLLAGLMAVAQDFEIVSVEHLPNDFIARKELKSDPEGRQCALLRIATQNILPVQREGFSFESDKGAYVVERATRDGEIWLWVSPNLKHLRVKHRDWGQVEIHMQDHVRAVESLHVYKVVLRGTLVSPPLPPPNKLVEQQYLVFKLTPSNAFLEVNGSSWEVDAEGMASAYVDFGIHAYRIGAPLYFTKEGTVEVNDPDNKKIVPVTLEPNFAQVTLEVDAEAEIWVNDEKKGIRTWTGILGSGVYKVECKQTSHETSMRSLKITPSMAGQTIQLDVPRPIYGSLKVESSPNLANVYIDGQRVGETPLFIHEKVLVGQREIRLSKDGYADYTQTVTIVKGEKAQLQASLSNSRDVAFTCNAKDAKLTIDGTLVGSANGSYQLTYGNHSVRVTAKDYEHYSATINVSLDSQSFNISMKSKVKPPKEKPVFNKHLYFETAYGFGMGSEFVVPESYRHYIGAQFTSLRRMVGYNIAATGGLTTGSMALMVGPTFRLNKGFDFSIQLYAHGGGAYNFNSGNVTPAAGGGFRFGFGAGKWDMDLFSLTLGAQYIEKEFVPMAGISIVPPVSLSLGYALGGENFSEYGPFFLEALVGYCDGYYVGGNLAVLYSYLGAYGSYMKGFNEGKQCYNVGPVIRFGDAFDIDIQIFQGIGKLDGERGGETGIRLALDSDYLINMASLSASVIYSSEHVGGTVGLCLPVAFIPSLFLVPYWLLRK